MRILAIGDSYTVGEGVRPSESWPGRLSDHLAACGVAADVRVIAATGWTTAHARAALAATAPASPFDAVTVQVGVNDHYDGSTPERYFEDLTALLDEAVSLAGGVDDRVVVVSIPDWSVTPYAEGRNRLALAASIDVFNEMARSAAASLGARWVDITSISRTAASRPDLLGPDGLHPTGEMYALWVPPILAALPRG
jgi:lysophospholipase L1-like esterase